MELLIVRHAIAAARGTFACSVTGDAERPLTAEGRRRFEKGARGLRRLLPRLDAIATSPLERAVATGEILAAAFDGAPMERLDALAPDAAPEALVAWLRRHPRSATVAIVGHEPGLGSLVGLLCAGRPAPFAELRKGGACLLAVSKRARPGTATLRWLLTAGQLRRVAR